MTFSARFWMERDPRGFVQAGVKGTAIRVQVGMRDREYDESLASEGYDRQGQADSIWQTEMRRCEQQAERLVREQHKRLRQGASKSKRRQEKRP